VGEDDGGGSVAKRELAEHRAQMSLDRGLADEQLIGDFGGTAWTDQVRRVVEPANAPSHPNTITGPEMATLTALVLAYDNAWNRKPERSRVAWWLTSCTNEFATSSRSGVSAGACCERSRKRFKLRVSNRGLPLTGMVSDVAVSMSTRTSSTGPILNKYIEPCGCSRRCCRGSRRPVGERNGTRRRLALPECCGGTGSNSMRTERSPHSWPLPHRCVSAGVGSSVLC